MRAGAQLGHGNQGACEESVCASVRNAGVARRLVPCTARVSMRVRQCQRGGRLAWLRPICARLGSTASPWRELAILQGRLKRTPCPCECWRCRDVGCRRTRVRHRRATAAAIDDKRASSQQTALGPAAPLRLTIARHGSRCRQWCGVIGVASVQCHRRCRRRRECARRAAAAGGSIESAGIGRRGGGQPAKQQHVAYGARRRWHHVVDAAAARALRMTIVARTAPGGRDARVHRGTGFRFPAVAPRCRKPTDRGQIHGIHTNKKNLKRQHLTLLT